MLLRPLLRLPTAPATTVRQFDRRLDRSRSYDCPGDPPRPSLLAKLVDEIGQASSSVSVTISRADLPMDGPNRMSRAASFEKANPREALSSWSDETPRSNSTPSQGRNCARPRLRRCSRAGLDQRCRLMKPWRAVVPRPQAHLGPSPDRAVGQGLAVTENSICVTALSVCSPI